MKETNLPVLFGRSMRRIHCVGVGGMGVAPLAVYLAERGFSVTGEDDALTDDVRRVLTRAGVSVGPLPERCDLIAYSSAIAKTHPTYVTALARDLPLVRRGELLAEVMRDRRLVAVCGAHGKTTTTAMLITALRAAKFPAGYVLGGLFSDETPPAAVGANDWVVAEIDESDGTIGSFTPELTVAVNLDWDHPDHYRRLADLEATFAALFARTRSAVLVNASCPLSAKARSRDVRPDVYRSFGPLGDFSAAISTEIGNEMTLQLDGRFDGITEASVQARGEFNAVNATAALAAAQLMGVKLTPPLLARYPGVRRRQGMLHEGDGFMVIEDYAHHPAEIRALLMSLRRRVAAGGRLVVVFQPHRFSRTAQFKMEFAGALALADHVHLLDVYSAGEAPLDGGTTAAIVAALRAMAPQLALNYAADDDEAFYQALTADTRVGDVIAFVGAGDIDRKARLWLERKR